MGGIQSQLVIEVMGHWGQQMVNLTLNNFEKEIINSAKPCIVAFKSDGCHLCTGLAPVLLKLRRRYIKKFKFAIINVDLQEALADIFNVEGVPTMFIFVNGDGKEIEYPSNPSLVSGYSEKYLIDYLENFFQHDQ